MPRVRSFPPVENSRARVLILGSMPGKASLEAGQYYAHPQNLFWRIMGDLLGAAPSLTYAARVRLLRSRNIALWDVLESCTREGSLDSAIDDTSIVPNNFASFYRSHPSIGHVFFNGAKAAMCYRRYVVPALGREVAAGLLPRVYLRLPSTSPAHAALTYAQKRKLWQIAVAALRG